MRERLIRILDNSPMLDTIDATYSEAADYLISKGVVLLPCKVGDKVYCVLEDFDVVMEGFVRQFLVTEEIFVDCVIRGYFNQVFHVSNFGKTVFLTRQEAEAKLKDTDK